MTTILAVDPSIRYVGWSILQVDAEQEIEEWSGGCLNYPDNYNIINLAWMICESLDYILPSLPSVVILEQPTFMSGAKGHIAAQKGYTLDLALLVGYIARHFTRSRYKPIIQLYRPIDWKGQVPKSATLAKFKRTFPHEKVPKTDHEIDARMLIVHYITSKEL